MKANKGKITLTEFEQAANAEDWLFASTLFPENGQRWLKLFSRSGGSLTLENEVIGEAAEIEAAGRRIVGAGKEMWLFDSRHHGIFWLNAGDKFLIQYLDGGRAEVHRDRILLPDGQILDAGEVASVETYLSGDWIERGVRLVLRDGGRRDIAPDQDLTPRDYWMYNSGDLELDVMWTEQLAKALANWLGVPWRNTIWPDERD